MLLTSHEMALRLEEADKIYLTRQIEACAQIFPDHKSFTLPVGHGVAAITLSSFGKKLNRVVGLGMGGPVTEDDLTKVEELFAKNGVNTEIAVCPLADPSVLEVLALRGYYVDAFTYSYAQVLTDEHLKEVKVDGMEISRVPAEEAHQFPRWSVAGFKDIGRAELLLETLAKTAILREDTSLYIATVDSKIAGTACMALIETSNGGVAHLYIDSTLPEYRG